MYTVVCWAERARLLWVVVDDHGNRLVQRHSLDAACEWVRQVYSMRADWFGSDVHRV